MLMSIHIAITFVHVDTTWRRQKPPLDSALIVLIRNLKRRYGKNKEEKHMNNQRVEVIASFLSPAKCSAM